MPPSRRSHDDSDDINPQPLRPIDGPDIYHACMPDDALTVYQAASPDVELDHEIRLVRTVIAGLVPRLWQNPTLLLKAVAELCKVIAAQIRAGKGGNDMAELNEMAEKALTDMEHQEPL